MRSGCWKSGREKRGPLAQGKDSRKGFKPDAAAGLNRNATTSACVGWDTPNIENQFALRKDRPPATIASLR
jgi:hypothetical protein